MHCRGQINALDHFPGAIRGRRNGAVNVQRWTIRVLSKRFEEPQIAKIPPHGSKPTNFDAENLPGISRGGPKVGRATQLRITLCLEIDPPGPNRPEDHSLGQFASMRRGFAQAQACTLGAGAWPITLTR